MVFLSGLDKGRWRDPGTGFVSFHCFVQVLSARPHDRCGRHRRVVALDSLLADSSKARRELGWRSETSFAELVRIMVEADLAAQEQASGRRRGGPGTR